MTPSTSLPAAITAGDSYNSLLTYSDYPATTWTLSYYLQGQTVLQASGIASGSDHSLVLSSTKTSTLVDGTYGYSVTMTNGTERHTIGSGYVTVNSNPANAVQKIVHAEKMFNAIQCVLEGRITDDVQQISIAGRSITNIPVAELLPLRAMYARELATLRGNGQPHIRTVKVNFRPTY